MAWVRCWPQVPCALALFRRPLVSRFCCRPPDAHSAHSPMDRGAFVAWVRCWPQASGALVSFVVAACFLFLMPPSRLMLSSLPGGARVFCGAGAMLAAGTLRPCSLPAAACFLCCSGLLSVSNTAISPRTQSTPRCGAGLCGAGAELAADRWYGCFLCCSGWISVSNLGRHQPGHLVWLRPTLRPVTPRPRGWGVWLRPRFAIGLFDQSCLVRSDSPVQWDEGLSGIGTLLVAGRGAACCYCGQPCARSPLARGRERGRG